MTIIVTSLDDMPGVLARRRPSHLITLLDPELLIATPDGFPADRHLRLGVHDIAVPMDGLVHPASSHVREILAFGRGWDAAAPLLVHCWAGISRSTATAFILACERNPAVAESRIARTLRSLARHAYPNRRLVALADQMLDRGGRMIEAVEAIRGDGVVSEGTPFELPVRY